MSQASTQVRDVLPTVLNTLRRNHRPQYDNAVGRLAATSKNVRADLQARGNVSDAQLVGHVRGGLRLIAKTCAKLSELLHDMFKQHGSWSNRRPFEVSRAIDQIDDVTQEIKAHVYGKRGDMPQQAFEESIAFTRLKKLLDDRLVFGDTNNNSDNADSEGPFDIVGHIMYIDALHASAERALLAMDKPSM